MFSSHLRASALTLMSIVAGATVAVSFAADTSTRTANVLEGFITGYPNSINEPSNPLSHARFDLISYVSHPCYTIVGNEAALCKDIYGLQESLKDMIDDGKLYTFLRQRGVISNTVSVSYSAQSSSASSSSKSSEAAATGPAPIHPLAPVASSPEYQLLLTKRSHTLWAACGVKFQGRQRSSCYQRNTRLINRFDVTIETGMH